jgi:hypothetical protein
MINPNIPAWRDFINGTPTLTAVTYYGIQGDFAVAAKSENVAMDAIDFNLGMWLCGGTDGTVAGWTDYQLHDEGTLVNRFGHFVTVGDTFFLQGSFVMGRDSAGVVGVTRFIDDNSKIEFPGGRVDTGDNKIEFDLTHVSTFIQLIANSITGTGRSGIKRWFDSSADQVNGTTEVITIVGHGFQTGDTVLYSAEGGTAISGLTDATEYFVNALTVDTIALYAMSGGRNDAYIDGTRINLTAAGTGQQHSFTRTPITWPDITGTGVGGTAEILGSTLGGINIVTMTPGMLIDATTFNAVHLIDMSVGATLSDCVINGQITTEGIAVVRTPRTSDITGCEFNASPEGGHAIEVEAAGDQNLVNVDFNNYGPSPAEFDGTADVSTGTEVITLPTGHGFVTGDAIYYNRRGNTALGGVTDQTRYYLNVVTNDVTLHVTKADAVAAANAVNITTTQTGTHALESANAAVVNSTNSAVTLFVSGGTFPSVRNSVAGGSTIVNTDVAVTFVNAVNGSEIRVYANGTTTELGTGIESSDGTDSILVAAGTLVEIVIHHINYEQIRLKGFTWPSTPTNFQVTQRLDRNFSNP